MAENSAEVVGREELRQKGGFLFGEPYRNAGSSDKRLQALIFDGSVLFGGIIHKLHCIEKNRRGTITVREAIYLDSASVMIILVEISDVMRIGDGKVDVGTLRHPGK